MIVWFIIAEQTNYLFRINDMNEVLEKTSRTMALQLGGLGALHGGIVSAALLVVAALSGCGKMPPNMAPPPSPASVAHPIEKEVIEWDTFSGHLQSPEMANVAARVSGLVVKMPFQEGAIVKQG